MDVTYDTLPLAFNEALRTRLRRESDSSSTVDSVLEEGWGFLLTLLERLRSDFVALPDLPVLQTQVKTLASPGAPYLGQCFSAIIAARTVVDEEGWRSKAAHLNLGTRLARVALNIEGLLQRHRRIDHLLITPPYPERLSSEEVSRFLQGTHTYRNAWCLYPPRFFHETRKIVLILPEQIQNPGGDMERVLAHEVAHAYLPLELHGFFLVRREDGMNILADDLGVSYRELPPFVKGNMLWGGLPEPLIESFAETVAAQANRNRVDSEIRKHLLQIMQQVDQVEITLARIRHARKSIRVLEVLPSKRLRGTLEKKLHYKRQISGMSDWRMRDQVVRRRWTHVQVLKSQLDTEVRSLHDAMATLGGSG